MVWPVQTSPSWKQSTSALENHRFQQCAKWKSILRESVIEVYLNKFLKKIKYKVAEYKLIHFLYILISSFSI